MDWQNIVMIIITVLLLGVWLPALILSVRKALRKGQPQRSPDPDPNNQSK